MMAAAWIWHPILISGLRSTSAARMKTDAKQDSVNASWLQLNAKSARVPGLCICVRACLCCFRTVLVQCDVLQAKAVPRVRTARQKPVKFSSVQVELT